MLRGLGTKRLGCERLSLIGWNTRPEVIVAMIVDKNFIFWNSKMINKNKLLRKVTENKNCIRIKIITQNRLWYLSLYFGSLKPIEPSTCASNHCAIALWRRDKNLLYSSMTTLYVSFLSFTELVLGTRAVKVKFHFYIF